MVMNMFATILKQLRNKNGDTQENLANALGIERSTIGKYEGKEQVLPSTDTLIRIADYYRVSVDYLLGRDSDSQKAEPAQTPDVAELVRLYSGMNLESRAMVLSFMRALAESPKTREAPAVVAGT